METVEADEADEAVEAVEVEAVVAAAVEAVEAVDRRSQGCWRLTSVRHLIILPRFCVTHLTSHHDGRNFFLLVLVLRPLYGFIHVLYSVKLKGRPLYTKFVFPPSSSPAPSSLPLPPTQHTSHNSFGRHVCSTQRQDMQSNVRCTAVPDATFCDILLHTSRSCPDSAVGSRAVEVIESSPRGRLFGGLEVGLCSPVERHERLRGFVVNEEGNRRHESRFVGRCAGHLH